MIWEDHVQVACHSIPLQLEVLNGLNPVKWKHHKAGRRTLCLRNILHVWVMEMRKVRPAATSCQESPQVDVQMSGKKSWAEHGISCRFTEEAKHNLFEQFRDMGCRSALWGSEPIKIMKDRDGDAGGKNSNGTVLVGPEWDGTMDGSPFCFHPSPGLQNKVSNG
jgi:hypothetical protein